MSEDLTISVKVIDPVAKHVKCKINMWELFRSINKKHVADGTVERVMEIVDGLIKQYSDEQFKIIVKKPGPMNDYSVTIMLMGGELQQVEGFIGQLASSLKTFLETDFQTILSQYSDWYQLERTIKISLNSKSEALPNDGSNDLSGNLPSDLKSGDTPK